MERIRQVSIGAAAVHIERPALARSGAQIEPGPRFDTLVRFAKRVAVMAFQRAVVSDANRILLCYGEEDSSCSSYEDMVSCEKKIESCDDVCRIFLARRRR